MNHISKALHVPLTVIILTLCVPTLAAVYVDVGAPGPGHDGSSWKTAYLTIQEGVNDSRAPVQGVWVAKGSYTENVDVLQENVVLFGGFDPNPLDPDPLGNRVPSACIVTPADTTLSIFTVATGGIINGFTITNGKAELGAGVQSVGSSLIVENCTIVNNMARMGAGIYAPCGYLAVKTCTFANNTAQDTAADPGIAQGAAIWVKDCTLAVADCSFANDIATVSNALTTGSTASGGAIFAQGGKGIRVERSIFTSCSATGTTLPTYYAYGGALFAERTTVYLGSNFFIGCSARAAGDTETSYGGALALLGSTSLNIRNNTFAKCAVTPNAGCPSDRDRPYGLGAAIYMIGAKPASIINNIIAKSRGTAVYNSGMAVTFNYNLLWHNAGGDIWGLAFPVPNPAKAIVDGNVMKDPQFRMLDDIDYHITLGSPAINAGTNIAAPSLDVDSENRLPAWDQHVDIGADEFIDSNHDGGADNDPRPPLTDPDNDHVKDPFDNAPSLANPDQIDSNGDGLGDVVAIGPVLYVDGSVATSGDGLSWGTAFKTIQEGIDAADTHNTAGWVRSPEVWVRGTGKDGKAIVYHENILLWHGVRVYGGWAGGESPATADVRSGRLLAEQPAGNRTVIDGGGVDTVVVIAHLPQDRYITDSTAKQAYDLAQSLIDGFTFTKGVAELGGGVSIYKETANVAACRIDTNRAALGGGVYIYKSTGVVGDGIGPLPGNILTGDTAISNNTVSGVKEYAGIGGGIYVENGSPTIFANVITGNSAYFGGAIAAVKSAPGIVLNLIGCKVHPNIANGDSVNDGLGGGVYLQDSPAVFDKDTIVSNSAKGAAGQGGAIWAETSDFYLKNSILSDNSAVDGGAIWADWSWPLISYSCFFSNGSVPFTGIDDLFVDPTTNLSADPLFVNPDTCDYRLQAGSPCVKAGDSSENPEACRPNLGAFQDVDPIVSIAEAKGLENGITVEIRDVVVAAVFPDCIYVEQADRSSGIKVRMVNSGVSEGQMVNVFGVVATLGGEKQLMNARLSKTVSAAGELRPLGIPIAKLSPHAGPGLSSIGLFIRTWGTVKEVVEAPSPMLIIEDGPGSKAYAFLAEDNVVPEVGQFVVLTGISSVYTDSDGSQVRAVRTRRGLDSVSPQR